MGNIENNICNAIDIIVDKALSNARFDKTIQATIISCIDKTIGKYTIKYQDSTFYAYSENIDVTYTNGSAVYVLVPANDFQQEKRILGTVKKLGSNYINIIEQQNRYETVGNNLINFKNAPIRLSTKYLDSNNKQNQEILLYSSSIDEKIDNDQPQVYSINANIAEYIKSGNAICFSFDVKTDIGTKQRYNGTYGIKITMTFNTPNGDTVDREFFINEDNFTGSVYNYPTYAKQYSFYDLNGEQENFVEIKKITAFCKNFPILSEGMDGAENIFLNNFEIFSSSKLTEKELSGYNLKISMKKGNYFNAIDSEDLKLTAEAQLQIKGSNADDNSQEIAYYWFIEDISVNYLSEYYNADGGVGWRCLNKRTPLNSDSETHKSIWTAADKYFETPPKKEFNVKDTKFKCVAVFKDNDVRTIIAKEFIVINNAFNYEIKITAEGPVSFNRKNPDLFNPLLTCLVEQINGDGKLTPIPKEECEYSWSYITDIGEVESITTQPGSVIEDYSGKIEKLNELLMKENNSTITDEERKELKDLQNIILRRSEDLLVDTNQIRPSLSNIRNSNTYYCSVKRNGKLLGQASIVLSFFTERINNYFIQINNGNQIFKYTEGGVAPTSASLDNPISLSQLTFDLFDKNGLQIPFDENNRTFNGKDFSTEWLIPIKDSMLESKEPSIDSIVEVNGVEYYSYKNLLSLTYGIKDKYNIVNDKNSIILRVYYDAENLETSTTFTFTKEGESGTNGTDYYCRIVPNSQYEDRIISKYIIYKEKADLDGNHWNFTARENEFPFYAELWRNSDLIFNSRTPQDKVDVKWKFLSQKYLGSITDDAIIFEVTKNGEFRKLDIDKSLLTHGICSILQVQITVKGETNNDTKIYYSTLPIVYFDNINKEDNLVFDDNSGFNKVVYNSAGINPTYDSNNKSSFPNFKINDIIYDSFGEPCQIIGSTKEKINGHWEYINPNVLNIETSYKGTLSLKPADKINGLCVNSALLFQIADVGNIYFPIHLYLNRFESVAINEWDGNSIELNEEEGMILAPQVGAGKKNENNQFTGVVIGTQKVSNGNNTETKTGLFAYGEGERSVFIDADTGNTILGKNGKGQIIINASNGNATLTSGNFIRKETEGDIIIEPGQGMEINLSEPSIVYGNEKFIVDKDGNLKASNATVEGYIKANDGFIGGIKIGSEGLTNENYDTFHINKDGSAIFKHFSAEGQGQIYLKSKRQPEDEESIIPYVKTEDGYFSDYDSNSGRNAMLYCDNGGNAHYRLSLGDLGKNESPEPQRDNVLAEIVITDSDARVQKADGTLLPILASNIGESEESKKVSNADVHTDMDGYITSMDLTFTDKSTINLPIIYDLNNDIVQIGNTTINWISGINNRTQMNHISSFNIRTVATQNSDICNFPIVDNYNATSAVAILTSKQPFKPDHNSWKMQAKIKITGPHNESRAVFGCLNSYCGTPSLEINRNNNGYSIWAGLSNNGTQWSDSIYVPTIEGNVWLYLLYEYDKVLNKYMLKMRKENEDFQIIGEMSPGFITYQGNDSIICVGGIAKNTGFYFAQSAQIDLSETWIMIENDYFLKCI